MNNYNLKNKTKLLKPIDHIYLCTGQRPNSKKKEEEKVGNIFGMSSVVVEPCNHSTGETEAEELKVEY